MNCPEVIYLPRIDGTPETELSALANVYAYILQKHQERQQAAHPGGPDDGERRSSVAATGSLPRGT
jgi:hypothetical protein